MTNTPSYGDINAKIEDPTLRNQWVRFHLRSLLHKLGLKSAGPSIRVSFAGVSFSGIYSTSGMGGSGYIEVEMVGGGSGGSK